MADNTRLPAGAQDGDTYAADEISSVKYQRVKIVLGADGVNDGDVSSANKMPVSGPLTDTELRATALPVDASGAIVPTQKVRASTPSQSSVGNSTSSVTLLSANASRLGATIYNDDSSASLKVKLGTTASSTSFTVLLAPGGYYEVPFGYTGRIDAIASVASGNARITELT
jgi:hypothetical protein